MSMRLPLLFSGLVVVGCIALPIGPAAADGCAPAQRSAATQSTLNACSAQAALRSGRDVARAYLGYRDMLTGGRRHALDATQRAWAKYRDTYCGEKGAAVSGGSIQPLVINTCMDTLNRRRAFDLAADRSGR